jgi:hypothetical protein
MQVMQMTVEDLVDRANKAEDADERTRLLERASETATKLAPYVHIRASTRLSTSATRTKRTSFCWAG